MSDETRAQADYEFTPWTMRRYQCEMCDGTGRRQAGTYLGVDMPAGTCAVCDGEGNLGIMNCTLASGEHWAEPLLWNTIADADRNLWEIVNESPCIGTFDIARIVHDPFGS